MQMSVENFLTTPPGLYKKTCSPLKHTQTVGIFLACVKVV